MAWDENRKMIEINGNSIPFSIKMEQFSLENPGGSAITFILLPIVKIP